MGEAPGGICKALFKKREYGAVLRVSGRMGAYIRPQDEKVVPPLARGFLNASRGPYGVPFG
jgi:hypothetical protein